MIRTLLAFIPALLVGCFSGSTDPRSPRSPFSVDEGTVLLADFDSTTGDAVSGTAGRMQNGNYVPSRFGSGIRSGTTGEKFLVTFPNSAPLSLSTGTLEAYVRCFSLPSGFAHIIDKSWQYTLSVENGRPSAWFGADWVSADTVLPLDAWVYLAATYDGDSLVVYLDGRRVAAKAYVGGTDPQYNTANDVGIGNVAISASDHPFSGDIDAVRISRIVRSPQTIAETAQRLR